MQAMSAQHHLVFGRRGSGKTSLLRKAEKELTTRGHPVAFVDLEVYVDLNKEQSFANLIANVLTDALKQYKRQAQGGLKTEYCDLAISQLNAEIDFLQELITSPDEANETTIVTADKKNSRGFEGGGGLRHGPLQFGAKKTGGDEATFKDEVTREYRAIKTEKINNKIGSYRDLFESLAQWFDRDVFLMLDEVYDVSPDLQPSALQYFSNITKSNRAWLKIGTVIHRSRPYVRTATRYIGLQLNQDVQQINLDASFENFSQTKRLLLRILNGFVVECGLNMNDLATGKAWYRLIQASGGVARDFLSLFIFAIDVFRERLARYSADRQKRIGADDVWDAAAKFNRDRREEFDLGCQASSTGNAYFNRGRHSTILLRKCIKLHSCS